MRADHQQLNVIIATSLQRVVPDLAGTVRIAPG
jgi:hypothetical protein